MQQYEGQKDIQRGKYGRIRDEQRENDKIRKKRGNERNTEKEREREKEKIEENNSMYKTREVMNK